MQGLRIFSSTSLAISRVSSTFCGKYFSWRKKSEKTCLGIVYKYPHQVQRCCRPWRRGTTRSPARSEGSPLPSKTSTKLKIGIHWIDWIVDTIWIHWVSGHYISQVHSILAPDVLHHLLRTTFEKSEKKNVFSLQSPVVARASPLRNVRETSELGRKMRPDQLYLYESFSISHSWQFGNLKPEPESCLSLRRKRSRWRISRTLEQSLSAREPKIWKDVRKKY